KDGHDQLHSISKEDKEKYMNYISVARKEYDDIAKREVQKAFVYSYEESARTLMDNYLDNVEAYCNKSKLTDPLTDEDINPDERLMRSIESKLVFQKMRKRHSEKKFLYGFLPMLEKANDSVMNHMNGYGKLYRRNFLLI